MLLCRYVTFVFKASLNQYTSAVYTVCFTECNLDICGTGEIAKHSEIDRRRSREGMVYLIII